MGVYKVKGGNRLCGEVTISGGKNAILPILAATVLVDGVSIIHNCPKISDVLNEIAILEDIGCKVKWENDTIIVDAAGAHKYIVPDNLAMQMRSSIIFLGALIGRFKKAEISYPGGCENFWRRGYALLYDKNGCPYRITGAFLLAIKRIGIYNQDYINRDYILGVILYVHRTRGRASFFAI